jgi:hypothetical protein
VKRTLVIGATRRQWLPAKVCEFSAVRLSSAPINVVHTFDKPIPEPENVRPMNRTGFSFVRFAAPELAGYEGRAVYLDSDMLLYQDIVKLFDISMGQWAVLRPANQSAVLLYDCARLSHWRVADVLARLSSGEYEYKKLMETLYEPLLTIGIPDVWNHMETFAPGRTCVLHYTKMDLQPWLQQRRNHLGPHWFEKLRLALKDGFVTMDEVEREVKLGHVGSWVLSEAAALA